MSCGSVHKFRSDSKFRSEYLTRDQFQVTTIIIINVGLMTSREGLRFYRINDIFR